MSGDHFLNLQPGTIVNGRYEVVKCLGTGSMGMVYACRHRELAGHIVAMKVLFSEVARDEVAAARFRNEIVASYGVSHPNVVRAYEYFRDGNLIAFTMEFIGGGDLADRIGNEELLPIEDIISMLAQMASGVQAIHDAGIIHRDLKPENILLTSQGDVKITDFGIARTAGGQKLTEHGGVVGTIDYVSPEYLERGQVDRRSDIYALGVMIYEMVTAEAPFKGNSVIETMTMRLRTDPTPPNQLRPECPQGLSDIVLKAMARDPDDRYQQAEELLADLNVIRGASAIQSRVSHQDLSSVIADSGRARAVEAGQSSGSNTSYQMQEGSSVAVGAAAGTSSYVQSFGAASPEHSSENVLEPEPYTPVESADGSGVKERIFPMGESGEVEPLSSGIESTATRVAVSNSNLTTQRIQELSLDLYQSERSIWRSLFSWPSLVAIVVGFGVGILIASYHYPHWFNLDEGSERPTAELAAE